MDKILSARVDESIIQLISGLAAEMRKSKKRVIEEAIRQYSSTKHHFSEQGILDATAGAWKRDASASEMRKEIRSTFERSMRRHQKQ